MFDWKISVVFRKKTLLGYWRIGFVKAYRITNKMNCFVSEKKQNAYDRAFTRNSLCNKLPKISMRISLPLVRDTFVELCGTFMRGNT